MSGRGGTASAPEDAAKTGAGIPMLNLVLYSDQTAGEGLEIDARLLRLLKEKRGGNRIGYIPSGPDPERYFLDPLIAYYARTGLAVPVCYDLNVAHDPAETAALFACDAIHLSGGHTGEFLARLRHSGMLGPLSDWARKGGILIGVSAGSILMTPDIATDALFLDARPEDVTDGAALDLLPFEYFPHLDGAASYHADLVRYSRHTPRPILACTDSDGLVVSDGRAECFGEPLWITGGVSGKADAAVITALLTA
ncbi:Type 1 glutamine amidotransferase-like domain-containing protein [Shinella sp. G-2]|uniref:Type 1 glutamine amidotransferase-like domain-containing protein n=1 Tax=Shinella sp. G-2 TaxID=3133141 RepID=UPI003CFE59EC